VSSSPSSESRPLVFEPRCVRCEELLARIPLDDDGDWKEAVAWSYIAFAQHLDSGACRGRPA